MCEFWILVVHVQFIKQHSISLLEDRVSLKFEARNKKKGGGGRGSGVIMNMHVLKYMYVKN